MAITEAIDMYVFLYQLTTERRFHIDFDRESEWMLGTSNFRFQCSVSLTHVFIPGQKKAGSW